MLQIKAILLIVVSAIVVGCSPAFVAQGVEGLKTESGVHHTHKIYQRRGLVVAPTPNSAVAYVTRSGLEDIDAKYLAKTCGVFGARLINDQCASLVAADDPVRWARGQHANLLYVVTLDNVEKDHYWWSPWWCECYKGVDSQSVRIAVIDPYNGQVLEQLVINSDAGWLDDDDRYTVYGAALEAALYTMAPDAKNSKIRWRHSH